MVSNKEKIDKEFEELVPEVQEQDQTVDALLGGEGDQTIGAQDDENIDFAANNNTIEEAQIEETPAKQGTMQEDADKEFVAEDGGVSPKNIQESENKDMDFNEGSVTNGEPNGDLDGEDGNTIENEHLLHQ